LGKRCDEIMMDAATHTFSGISIDRRRMLISRGDEAIAFEPKALDVLFYLLDHRDRLVTKDELLEAIWKDAFVTPNVLTRAVAQLRKGLGDDADAPRIIETVARRGYRFIAPVEEKQTADTAASQATEAQPHLTLRASTSAGPRRSPDWRRKFVFGTGLVVIAVAVGFLSLPNLRRTNRPDRLGPTSLVKRRLTTRSGYNSQPVLSPDGHSLAYVSDVSGTLEIYVMGLLATGREFALTTNGGQNVQPNWSPDGQWIAFHSLKNGGIWVEPANGGQPQQITDFGSFPSWAPDGDQLVFTSDSGGFAEQAILWTVHRDGSGRRPLTEVGKPPGGALMPSWSHNGKLIAFVNRFGGAGGVKPGIFVLSLSDGRVHSVSNGKLDTPVFAPDDAWLYCGGFTTDLNPVLGRVPIDPNTGDARGDLEVILPLEGIPEGLSIAKDGTMAFSTTSDDDNFWTVDISTSGSAGETVRLTDAAVRNNRPSYSETGRIAYMQFVVGRQPTTWVMNEDGSHSEALLPGAEATDPQWSSDGSRLFVMQHEKGLWVDFATRRITPLPITIEGLGFPRLSPDDREVAFHRIDANGQMHVWIKPLDGGPERRVASDREGVGFPIWSPDGRMLAVEIRRGDQAFIGVTLPDGKSPITQIVFDDGNSWPNSWSPDGKRIAYAGQRNGVWNVWEVSVETKVSRPLTRFTLPIGYVRYPSWAPRGDRVVFERDIHSGAVWVTKIAE
jgi:Tol biopolymer transport system component/DNA-binding winged helix-turn-helix (wHTH) protein